MKMYLVYEVTYDNEKRLIKARANTEVYIDRKKAIADMKKYAELIKEIDYPDDEYVTFEDETYVELRYNNVVHGEFKVVEFDWN